MYESNDKLVSHPAHYNSNGMEVIDVIEAFTDGLTGIEATDTGNIIKYACRWKNKGGLQDVEKIIWYATHLRDHLMKKASMVKEEGQTNPYSFRSAVEAAANELYSGYINNTYITFEEKENK